MLVGVGGACAQSVADTSGVNRVIIRDELLRGTPPAEIITILSQRDPSHQRRQYGIVDTQGRATSFTGSQAGAWAGGLTGEDGTLVYAIQGNLLTGEPVVREAERALLETPGDLPAKLMASMEAAAAEGGDARCTPAQKSSHIGFMIVSRLGDTDGGCASNGCATGDYFMAFNVPFARTEDPDPVIQMRHQFDAWRALMRDRPDAIQSVVQFDREVLRPTGGEVATMTITLLDWRGEPAIATTEISVEHEPDSDRVTSIGSIIDLGRGRFSVEITGGWHEGTDRYRITAQDSQRPVRLSPSPSLSVQTEPGKPRLRPPVPGRAGEMNALCVLDGEEGTRVYFVYSRELGSAPTPCGPIGLSAPILAGSRLVRPNGRACIRVNVPRAAQGRTIHLQALHADQPECDPTNVISWTFE